MRSKTPDGKTTSGSHFRLVGLREGEEKLNLSGSFLLPVVHPRPKGQVIASRFVEKVMLDGLTRIKCQDH